MKWAFVFPGQGSQRPGMGQRLAEECPAARAVFEEVDDALSRSLSQLAWEGPAETLALTENAQPAIMAASLAALRALEAELGGPFNPRATFAAGHSLGEFSALAACGAIGIGECARLLEARGKAMQAASPRGQGAMAAVIGLDIKAIRDSLPAASHAGVCEIANDNAPGQATISGHAEAVARAVEACRTAGARRAVMLDVSAPFHCALMEPAARAMEPLLKEAGFGPANPQVVSNVAARPAPSPGETDGLLTAQITGMVRWRESVEWMAAEGIGGFVECGTGKVLTGLIRRTARGAQTLNVEDPQSAAAAAAALSA